MRYVTLDDIQRAIPAQTLIWLTNDDPAALSFDTGVLEMEVAAAETMVDGYLMGRYAYPLNPASSDLRQIVIGLARANLYGRRPEGNDLPEAVKLAYRQAISTVELARDGKYQISGQTGAMQQAPQSIKITTRRKVFSDKMLGLFD